MIWPDLRPPERPRPLAARLGWMALIWLIGVLSLGAVAMVLRWWLVS